MAGQGYCNICGIFMQWEGKSKSYCGKPVCQETADNRYKENEKVSQKERRTLLPGETRVKVTTCSECHDSFEYKTKPSVRCPVCRKEYFRLKTNNKMQKWNLNNPEKCSQIQKKYHDRIYSENPQEHITRAKNHSAKNKDLVFDFYGRICNCCGEIEQVFLTIDHVNNDGSEDRKMNYIGHRLYQKIVTENFPDKYQILCMNCNWAKRYGECPHKK